MTGSAFDSSAWRYDIRQPLRVPVRPIFRPYLGGHLRRMFRGRTSGGDDHWTDEWIGSDISAGNPDPDGQVQGLTLVRGENDHEALLAQLIEAFPVEMLGEAHVERHGAHLGFLVKLIGLGVDGPMHTHPDDAFAREHLGLDQGQAEAWIPLEANTPDEEPLRGGVGFAPGVQAADLRGAIDNGSTAAIRDLVKPVTVSPRDAWLIRPGTPHWIGAEVLFIEIQQPSDVSIVAEHWVVGADEQGATAGLGWDVGLGAFALETADSERSTVPEQARQRPAMALQHERASEMRLIEADAEAPFDVRRVEVVDELTIQAGRFSTVVVSGGDGSLAGEWGRLTITRGDVLAVPASLEHRFVAGTQPLQVHRCMGPPIDR